MVVMSYLGGKCDVIFSYIYTNTTKLVILLSYLVRLGRSIKANLS